MQTAQVKYRTEETTIPFQDYAGRMLRGILPVYDV